MKKPLTIKRVKELERLSRLLDATAYPNTYKNTREVVGTFNTDPSIEEAATNDFFEGYDLERIIFALPRTETSIMLFRYLGFNSAEITEILELKNKRKCYNYAAFLKQRVSNIKQQENPL